MRTSQWWLRSIMQRWRWLEAWHLHLRGIPGYKVAIAWIHQNTYNHKTEAATYACRYIWNYMTHTHKKEVLESPRIHCMCKPVQAHTFKSLFVSGLGKLKIVAAPVSEIFNVLECCPKDLHYWSNPASCNCQEWIDATHLELPSKDARNYEELMSRVKEAEACRLHLSCLGQCAHLLHVLMPLWVALNAFALEKLRPAGCSQSCRWCVCSRRLWRSRRFVTFAIQTLSFCHSLYSYFVGP